MSGFEWFLLIVIVIVVPLAVAAVVTLWTIDQANKRKRANRKDAQIGVKRKAALSPEEVEARKAERAKQQQSPGSTTTDGATVGLITVGDDEYRTDSSPDVDTRIDATPDAGGSDSSGSDSSGSDSSGSDSSGGDGSGGDGGGGDS